MLRKALEFLVTQLKTAVTASGEGSVALCSIVNSKGEYGIAEGKLGVCLVNVEEERFLKVQLPREKRNGDQVQITNPEIKLNLLIMLAANPGASNYGLDRLSEAITFFQGTSFFDKNTKLNAGDTPLWPEIEQLSVELYSLTLDQQNQLWASLGAKYLPSVIYKVRLVVIDGGKFGEPKPVIRAIDNDFKKIR